MRQLEHSAWGQSFQFLGYEVPVTSITVLSVPAASSVMLPGSLVFSRPVSVSTVFSRLVSGLHLSCLWSSPPCLWFSPALCLGVFRLVSELLSPSLQSSLALSLVFSSLCPWSPLALSLVFSRPVFGLFGAVPKKFLFDTDQRLPSYTRQSALRIISTRLTTYHIWKEWACLFSVYNGNFYETFVLVHPYKAADRGGEGYYCV